MRKEPDSPYANGDGFVPFGNLVDYTGGRSNGCTSWSPSDLRQILPLVQDNHDAVHLSCGNRHHAVARAVAAGQSPARAGLYWNASCLSEIRSPKFWTRQILEPLIVQYARSSGAAASADADLQVAMRLRGGERQRVRTMFVRISIGREGCGAQPWRLW